MNQAHHRGGKSNPPIIVAANEDRQSLERALFSPDREVPIVVVTGVDGKPALPLAELARAIRSEHACYFVADPGLLDELNQMLGRRLRVPPHFIRVFWPNLKLADDPAAHPGIPVLFSEPVAVAVEAFAYAFDLSRPRVRRARELQGDADAIATSLAAVVRRTARARQSWCGRRGPGGCRLSTPGPPALRGRRGRRR